MHSIILTIHNKGWLLPRVLDGILNNTLGDYELISVLDGCTDESEIILNTFIENNPKIKTKILYAPDVYETISNNIGMKSASGDKVIIVQDDMVVQEKGWNQRLEKPFKYFDDVFAVTARTAHNWIFNPDTQHLGMDEDLDYCWCDILTHVDHAGRQHSLPRNIFAVRNTVNRGPLMIDHDDLKKLNYLDEVYAPLEMDEHDLCYRAYKELNKVVGCYWIDYRSDDSWGGTRVSGTTASWHLKASHKNMKIFYQKHKDLITNRRLVENRFLEE